MSFFGVDFWRAGHEWIYPREKQQGFWRGLILAVGLFFFFQLLQIFVALSLFIWKFDGSLLALKAPTAVDTANFLKASIIGMFPAAIPTLFLGLYLARFGLPKRQGALPLQWPKLGVMGWFIVVAGFGLLMALLFNGLFWLTGIDPATYAPTSGGLADAKSQAGLVEKTMAELSKDKILYAFALPSIVFAAPFAEEFLFRGLLFSSLVRSPLGPSGAVLITAVLWALAHAGAAPWMVVGLLFVMGLILGLLLLRFGSLWVTIACHTAWNTLSSVAILGLGANS